MPRRHERRGASVVPSCRSSRCPAPYAAKCSGVITRGLARTSSCDVLPEREFPHFPICGGCEQQTCCTGQRKRHQMKVDNMYFLILPLIRLHILSCCFFAIAMHIILRHFIWFMSFGPFFLLLRVVTSFSSASCKTVSETQLVRSGARFVASKMDAILDKALLSQSSNKEWGVTRECTASSFSGSRFACFVTLCVEPRWRKQPYSFVH